MARLDDPLKNWPNSDLLIDDEERQKFYDEFPSLAPIFDFETLRLRFEKDDRIAKSLKGGTQFRGVAILSVSALGVILLSISGFIDEPLVARIMTVIALLLTLAGGVAGILIKLFEGDKRERWMQYRCTLERMRQFQFQFIINNWNLAVDGMSDPVRLNTYKDKREKTFASVMNDIDNSADYVKRSIDDVSNSKVWHLEEWKEFGNGPVQNEASEDLSIALQRFRVAIQLKYSSENLKPDANSVAANAETFKNLKRILYVITLICSFFGLLSLAAPQLPFIVFGIGMVLSGTSALLLQALQLGLRSEEDVDRYESYHAQISNISSSFVTMDTLTRYALLRQLEAVTYEEMRSFLKVHTSANFEFIS